MHPFLAFISRYAQFSPEDWEAIEVCLIRKEYSSNTLILKSGSICNTLYFLETGFLRYFVYREGEDLTRYFTEAPYCFTSQRSFTQDLPTIESIETLEPSIIWEIPKADAYALLRLPPWSEFVRKLVQEVQFYTEEIMEALKNETAETRYVQMVQAKSEILQKASLKHIASYLGIAPQSLSRIRKKYLEDSRT